MKHCIRIVLIAMLTINIWSCADQQLENGPRNLQAGEDFTQSQSSGVQSLLVPAFTFTSGYANYTGFSAEAGADPWSKTADLQVDWGQPGLPPENITIQSGYDTIYSHGYPGTDNYRVRITGELDKVVVLGLESAVDTVDARALQNLSVYRGRFNDALRSLDLSNSHGLSYLDLMWLYSLTSLKVPADAPISYIRINGIPLTTTQLADLINGIYTTAVSKGIVSGYFEYYDMPNTFTPATLAQLKSLQDDYGWNLAPAIP